MTPRTGVGVTRVVLVAKALTEATYRAKAERMGAAEDIALTVVVPERWRENGRDVAPAPAGPGYDLVTTRVWRPGDFHLHWFPDLGRLFHEHPPDVVHLDDEPYNLATALGLRAAASVGAKGLFFAWQNLDRRLPWPFRYLEASVFRRAAGAIAGTEAAARVLRGKGYGGPLWVVPQFGVDEERFHPADGARPGRPFTVGYVGRLVPEKGVDLLVAALGTLPAPWVLEIAGDGPSAADLATRARALGAAVTTAPAADAEARGAAASGPAAPRQVRFHGWLPGDALAPFYRTLDAFVLPSRSTTRWVEQFGRVLLEAMASGVPCVGAVTGEVPEVLGDAGLTFPEGDVAALAASLARLASDAALGRELARRGRERVLARFTMGAVAAATVDVYRAVAGNRPRDAHEARL